MVILTSRVRNLLLPCLLLLLCNDVVAQPAVIVTDTALLQRPAFNAPRVTALTAGSPVEYLSRSGGWKQVRFQSRTGWVRSYQVRSGALSDTLSSEQSIKNEKSSGGFLSVLASLSRKASGLFSSGSNEGITSQRTATIGIRGRGVATNQALINSYQFSQAKPDFSSLKRMETMRGTQSESRQFARQGNRKPVDLAHLPASEAEK